MDFIEQLLPSEGKNVIWVIVDLFTKYSHFIALHHPFTASSLALIFLDHIYRLHGLPNSIISDRDKIFVSKFWQQLLSALGIQQHLSTAYHPQTDGQTERVNQCLENCLRCMCSSSPKQWAKWLPMAEWWYNTNYHTAIGMTPFEALYGYKPSHIPSSPFQTTSIISVEDLLQDKNLIQYHLKQHLKQALDCMK